MHRRQVYLHVQEGVLVQITVEVHIRLHAPIIVKARQQRVPMGKAAEVPEQAGIRAKMPLRLLALKTHVGSTVRPHR